MNTNGVRPLRGELWRVNLDPTVGAEIQKTRPAIVVSSDGIGRLPLRLIVPITGWQEKFAQNHWHVKLLPSPINGLTKISAADTLQDRGVDTQRFIVKMGRISADTLE